MPVGSSHRLAMRSTNALPMADTLESTMSTPCTCRLAASMTLVTFPTPILEYAPRFGVGSGTARRYLQSLSPQTDPGAAFSPTIVANALFWTGFPSQSGLLHTKLTRLPWRLFLNSTFCPPAAYHHPMRTAPTRPTHDH